MPRSTLDERDRELVKAKNFAHVSTLRPDGTILTLPVWVDLEGDEIVLNSAEGRAWPRNLRERGQITVTVQNLENPYEYVTITGRKVDDTNEGADAVIDALAKKYLDVDSYPARKEGEKRVTFKIAPERVYRNT